MKKLLRFLLRLLYGFRVYNEEVLSAPGPVLLIPNHVAWLDWLFIGVCLDDDWKFVTSSVTAQTTWIHRLIMINRRTFPVDVASPYAAKRMAEHLAAGGRLVLYAEGRMTATGSLMKLFDGTGFLLNKTNAKIITAYLRGVSRIPWVRHKGWTRWFPRTSVHFSDPQMPPKMGGGASEARRAVTRWLRQQMVSQQFQVEMEYGPADLLSAVCEMANRLPNLEILEDASRQTVTYRRAIMGAKLLAACWRTRLRGQDRVGVLLPNVNATPVVLLSLWAAGKIPAVLNFSTGPATMAACVELAGLKQVVTSRVFLERAKLDVTMLAKNGVRLLYLEDVRATITGGEKLAAWLFPRPPAPIPALGHHTSAAILFTSGSEGAPKGVELTHGNILANIRQVLAVTDIQDSDRIFNALPVFHSFGLAIGTLLPLVRGLYLFLYPSPLHYRMVPAVVYDRNCTILLSTNTFLNGYARKANPYDFRSLRYLFAGAEKVQEATANVWARQFGARILEGYGATECSPCISVNTPLDPKFGSAGQLLPGMEYKIEPVEGVAEGGRLLVRGPNVMRGYLNLEANAIFKAMEGWYDTGDIAAVDKEGFIHLLGRLKRFAKISGEMVSLTAIEEALAGAFVHFGQRCEVAIVSQPDTDKGEALIAVCNERRVTLEMIRSTIRGKGLTNLCVPREVRHVKEIPKLGTGKTNHRELAGRLQNGPS